MPAKRRAPRASSRNPRQAAPPQPTRTMTILAQDPTLVVDGRILTAEVSIPNELLSAGPRGYRVQVVDYDASSNQWFVPLEPSSFGSIHAPRDPYKAAAAKTR